jgi:starch-binding outer membrane protein, SusD/RagB family
MNFRNMKQLRFRLFFIVLICLWGCDNFLGYDETTVNTKEEIFSDFAFTKAFLSNIYSRLPEGFDDIGNSMRASASDEAVEIQPLAVVQRLTDGSWSAIQTIDSQWSNLYSGIRAVNLFLKETEGQTFEDQRFNANYDQIMEQFGLYPYEARFLRAYFYFELIKRYKNVPLIITILEAEDANSVQSTPFADVVQFIVDECDTVAQQLPVNYSSISLNETGRATRGAAMALKARTLLYAASPLFNESGGTEEWYEAAVASKAIIDSTWYSLINDYSSIINNRTSNELIFERRLGQSNTFERSNFPIGFEGATPRGTAPTQNLVDSYEMQSTGLMITDAGSGYNADNPYEGRDPRLSHTVIYNNSQWKGQTVEIWNEGQHGPPQQGATVTGYYLKKGVIESINLAPGSTTQQIHTWVLFRYGEVLLNYAEAMNEVFGPSNASALGMSALEAVNLVRNRANMPEFPSGLTQQGFREKLRNERKVELAFEDHRFWDLRRWEIGPSTTDIYGIDITRSSTESFSYNRKLVQRRVWEDKMYLYPLPQTELFVNENLVQNPGW